MKKLLALSLALNTVLVVSLAVTTPSANSGSPTPDGARANGDANCDGDVDMSDAVFILNWLFLGANNGPCPLAEPTELRDRVAELEGQLVDRDTQLADLQDQLGQVQAQLEETQGQLEETEGELATCRDRVTTRLPTTGQTICYDTAGNIVNCASSEWPGQDGYYQSGCPLEGRFVDNDDGTILDTCTGLLWQKVPVSRDWQGALHYCEDLELGEYSDWRLPNVLELVTLVDYAGGLCNGPGVDTIHTAFGMERYGTTWTSTTTACSPDFAWYVQFHEGEIGRQVPKTLARWVRAVRGP